MSVRTVHLTLAVEEPGAARNRWPVRVVRSVFLGDMTQVHVDWGGRELVVRRTGMESWPEGQPAALSADPQRCILLEDGAA